MARRMQPTDSTVDAREIAATELADDDLRETPDLDDVMQRDEEVVAAVVVPVRLVEVPQLAVEAVPTLLESARSIRFATTDSPRRVLAANRRRARVTMWATGSDLIVGGSAAECSEGTGAILSAGLAVPYHFGFWSELWAAPAEGAAEVATLNLLTEAWSR